MPSSVLNAEYCVHGSNDKETWKYGKVSILFTEIESVCETASGTTPAPTRISTKSGDAWFLMTPYEDVVAEWREVVG